MTLRITNLVKKMEEIFSTAKDEEKPALENLRDYIISETLITIPTIGSSITTRVNDPANKWRLMLNPSVQISLEKMNGNFSLLLVHLKWMGDTGQDTSTRIISVNNPDMLEEAISHLLDEYEDSRGIENSMAMEEADLLDDLKKAEIQLKSRIETPSNWEMIRLLQAFNNKNDYWEVEEGRIHPSDYNYLTNTNTDLYIYTGHYPKGVLGLENKYTDTFIDELMVTPLSQLTDGTSGEKITMPFEDRVRAMVKYWRDHGFGS